MIRPVLRAGKELVTSVEAVASTHLRLGPWCSPTWDDDVPLDT